MVWYIKESWANKPPEHVALSRLQAHGCQPTNIEFQKRRLEHVVLESFLGWFSIVAHAGGKNYHIFCCFLVKSRMPAQLRHWVSWSSTGNKVLLPPLEQDRCASHAPRRCNVFRICMKWGKPNVRSPPLAWQFPGQPSFNIFNQHS